MEDDYNKEKKKDIILEWNIILVSHYHFFNKKIQKKQKTKIKQNNQNNQDNQDNQKPYNKDYFLLDLNYYIINNREGDNINKYIVNNSDFDLRSETLHKVAKEIFPFIVEYSLDFKTTFLFKKDNLVIISIIFDKTKNNIFEYDKIFKEWNYSIQFSKKLFVNYKKSILNIKTSNDISSNNNKYNILKGLLECYLNDDYLKTNLVISNSLDRPIHFSLEKILKTIKPYYWINNIG